MPGVLYTMDLKRKVHRDLVQRFLLTVADLTIFWVAIT